MALTCWTDALCRPTSVDCFETAEVLNRQIGLYIFAV